MNPSDAHAIAIANAIAVVATCHYLPDHLMTRHHGIARGDEAPLGKVEVSSADATEQYSNEQLATARRWGRQLAKTKGCPGAAIGAGPIEDHCAHGPPPDTSGEFPTVPSSFV
jgi:hypothetical protein